MLHVLLILQQFTKWYDKTNRIFSLTPLLVSALQAPLCEFALLCLTMEAISIHKPASIGFSWKSGGHKTCTNKVIALYSVVTKIKYYV